MSVDLAGYRILILQDDVTVWLELEAVLSNAGCENISSFHHIEIAELWIEHVTPGLAIIDMSLNDCSSLSIATKLGELNVPVLIYSEERPMHLSEGEISNQSTWLQKPAPPHAILAAVGCLLDQRIDNR